MATKIVLKQTSIYIYGYEVGDFPGLEKSFSIYDKVTHRTMVKGIDYNPETKLLIVPRGIDVGWLERGLNCYSMIDRRYDDFDKQEVRIRYMPRDDVQVEALEFMIGEGNYPHNASRSQLSVNLNTGAGKTYACIATMAYTGMRSIMITSSTGWLDQWKDKILEYTDMKPKEIYFLTGSPSINHIIKHGASAYKFILATHSTITSYAKSHGWEAVRELFRILRVGIKFYDEAHLYFDNLAKIDFYTNTFKTFYVTATPARSSHYENEIYQYYFKNVPKIDLFREDTDPRTAYHSLLFNSHPDIKTINTCKNAYGLDRNRYTNYLVSNPWFIELLHILVHKIKETPGKVLIYVGTNEAIFQVIHTILDFYPELYSMIGVYTSVIVDKEQREDVLTNKKIIFSTTKSAGAAMDIKDLKMTIVLAEPFKSEVLARQSLGRTRAPNTDYIEVVDVGFYHLRKFYVAKKPIFDKYATSVDETKMTDDMILEKSKAAQDYYNSLVQPITWYPNGAPEMASSMIFYDKNGKEIQS